MSTTSNFPAIRLADATGGDDPAEARKRMLKELAGRLDEPHVFAKGQFVAWKRSAPPSPEGRRDSPPRAPRPHAARPRRSAIHILMSVWRVTPRR